MNEAGPTCHNEFGHAVHLKLIYIVGLAAPAAMDLWEHQVSPKDEPCLSALCRSRGTNLAVA